MDGCRLVFNYGRKRTEHPPASVFMEAILKALWEAKGNGVSQEETQ